jgi:putative ABC transport system ATP-binding protein
MNQPASIVSFDNIHKTYLLGVEGVAALRGVKLEIFEGEFIVIFGPSGCGKSSLLNILGTIDTPTKGNLTLFDSSITDRTRDEALAGMRSRHIGFVFQNFNLLSTMDAVENVALPMTIAGDRPRDQIRKRAVHLLKQVGLGQRLTHFPAMLSGGEQQRVTIARALANDPKLLLLDEPTGDLDTTNADNVMNILLELNIKERLTMVMVTHDVYMKQYATRVLLLRDGVVQAVENVDPFVRESAINELKRRLLKKNAPDVCPQKTTTTVRQPESYTTCKALCPLRQDEDPQMRDVVSILFGKRHAADPRDADVFTQV